jgi:hypothetical protein
VNVSASDAARLEAAEAEAWIAMYEAAPASYGAAVHRVGDATCLVLRAADTPLFNRVLGLGLSARATVNAVHDALARYADAGVANVNVQLAPGADPPELCAWLLARGFRPAYRWVKVRRGPDAQVAERAPSALRVVEIGRADAAAWAETAAAGFGAPPLAGLLAASVGVAGFRPYLALDGDAPAGAGALYLARDGQTAWLGVGATRPDARRKGAQGALMARRVGDALAAGRTVITTETGEERRGAPNPSYHNMRRTGFAPAYFKENWTRR